ncbi:MAG: peptidyl-prolyl cis-trans isomerase [Lachnospiraceae bacterium]|nr:peptidyl-prolyl cis-trans isomerase [Lachnospiraceae bacterium]
MKMIKGVLSIIITAILALTLTSCGGNKAVFKLNGTKVDSRDVDVFGYMYVMEHGIVDVNELDEIYDNGETYAEHYKADLEKEIVLSVLLSKEADDNKVVLSSEDKEKAKNNAAYLVDKLGEDKLKEHSIEKSDVERIYEMRLRGSAYAASVGDKYADVLSSSSVNMKGDDKASEASLSGDSSDRYVRVFQVTFPTAVFDESGIVKTDKNGEIITVSNDEKEQMKTAASEFSEKAGNGEDIEKLLKNEPANVTGVERTLKYSDLSEEYKAAVDSLSENKTSSVINGDYGYYVIKLLEKDDAEHAAGIEQYEKQLKAIEAKNELYEKLLNTYVGSDKDYRNDELWEQVSIIEYAKK